MLPNHSFYRRDRVIFFIHSPLRENGGPTLYYNSNTRSPLESYKNRFYRLALILAQKAQPYWSFVLCESTGRNKMGYPRQQPNNYYYYNV
jgi:hypothetical protein